VAASANVGNDDGEGAGEGVGDGETVLAHAEMSRAIKTTQLRCSLLNTVSSCHANIAAL